MDTKIKQFISEGSRRWLILLIVGILISVFVLGNVFSPKCVFRGTIKELDRKELEMTAFTGIAAAAATALALVPDDSTTPVANQIAEVAGDSFLIMLVLAVEKFFVGISGYLAFGLLFPLAAISYYLCRFKNDNEKRKMRAKRYVILGIAVLLIIPVSLSIDNLIDDVVDISKATRIDQIEEEVITVEIENAEEEKNTIFKAAGEFFSNLFNSAVKVGEEAINTLNDIIDEFIALIIKLFILPLLTLIVLSIVVKWFITGKFEVGVSELITVRSKIRDKTFRRINNNQFGKKDSTLIEKAEPTNKKDEENE